MKKIYSVGICASMLNTVNQLSCSLNVVFGIVPALRRDGIYADKILALLNYQSKIEGIAAENEVMPLKEIELKDVSFKYENSTEYVLKGINMKIKQGDKIAIVGLNGAGKSTLIHLILHFYDPTEGCITYNQKDIRNRVCR